LPDEPADPELRVRFTTATALVNELVEARAANILSRALGRWERIELIGIDELGYVPLAEIGAELLFQVIADQAELPVHAVGDLPPVSLARGRPAQECLRYVGSLLNSALQSLASGMTAEGRRADLPWAGVGRQVVTLRPLKAREAAAQSERAAGGSWSVGMPAT
jgi:IstB-like ATP binding protein